MRREQTETVRELAATRGDASPVRRLPRRRSGTTKQMHERLLRALADRRVKRAFS
jgi:hypothetical protein